MASSLTRVAPALTVLAAAVVCNCTSESAPRTASERPTFARESVGAENGVDSAADTVLPAANELSAALVALPGGTTPQFFGAWTDERTSGITGARITAPSYTPIASDLTGIPLVIGAPKARVLNPYSAPGIASDGTSTLLLAWTEEHSNAQNFAYFERIDAATGAVFPSDAGGVQIGPAGALENPAVGWDGHEFVVAWQGLLASDGTMPILTLRVDPASGAKAADGSGVRLSTASGGVPTSLQTSCMSDRCLFVWNDTEFEMHLFLGDGSTAPSAPTVIPGATNLETLMGVANDGNRFLVAWNYMVPEFGTSPGSSTVRAAVIHSNGVYQETAAGQMMVSGPQNFSGLLYAGGNFVFAGPTSFGKIDSNLTFGTAEAHATTYLSSAALALSNGGLLEIGQSVTFSPFANGAAGAIFGTAIDATTYASTAGLLVESVGAVSERAPSLVTSSGSLPALFNWQQSATNTDTLLYSRRLDPTSGAPRSTDVSGTLVDSDSTPYGVPRIATATDGHMDLVAWVIAQARGFYYASYSPDTNALSTPTAVDLQQNALGSIAAAYGGGTYLVVTSDGARVKATPIDATSHATGTSIVLSDGSLSASASDRGAASVSYDGAQFFVVWSDGRSGRDATYGMHVTTAGVAVESDGYPLSTGLYPQTEASVVFASANATSSAGGLVVWRDTRDEAIFGNIYGRRLDAHGMPVGSDLAIAVAANDQSTPVVADSEDGLNYQVVWKDERSDTNGDLYGALVGLDGTLRQANGIGIATTSDGEGAPVLTTTSAGQMLLAYVRHDSGVALGTDRIRTRVISTGRAAGKCSSNDDCATLDCVDGVCCNTACNGACERCDGATPGICTPVLSGTDPGTCSGTESCTTKGTCAKDVGQTCSAASECVSGFCADGVCCDSACSGGCDACNVSAKTAGTCTILPAGSTGANPSCLPDTCNGASAACPSGCTSDSDCVRPFACNTKHQCELLAGAICADDHTLENTDGTLTNCTPYACESSACAHDCHSIKDCAAGSICNGNGTCVSGSQASTDGGCSTVGARDSSVEWSFAALAGLVTFGLVGRRRKRA